MLLENTTLTAPIENISTSAVEEAKPYMVSYSYHISTRFHLNYLCHYNRSQTDVDIAKASEVIEEVLQDSVETSIDIFSERIKISSITSKQINEVGFCASFRVLRTDIIIAHIIRISTANVRRSMPLLAAHILNYNNSINFLGPNVFTVDMMISVHDQIVEELGQLDMISFENNLKSFLNLEGLPKFYTVNNVKVVHQETLENSHLKRRGHKTDERNEDEKKLESISSIRKIEIFVNINGDNEIISQVDSYEVIIKAINKIGHHFLEGIPHSQYIECAKIQNYEVL